MADAVALADAARPQRVDGALRLEFRHAADGRTRLADLYQRAPCRVLFPDIESEEPAQAVLLTTSGGLTGGDRLDIRAVVGAGAAATLTTQAAEKLYRAQPGDPAAEIGVHLSVGAGAWAEWLAQETILFDRSRLVRRLDLDLAADARLLAVESLVFGRAAMGESHQRGTLLESWRVRRDGRLVWADGLRLEGEMAACRQGPFGLGRALAAATLLLVAPAVGRHLPAVRERLSGLDCPGGATDLGGLLLVRLLADDPAALRRAVMVLAGYLRQAEAGLPDRLPRVWSC